MGSIVKYVCFLTLLGYGAQAVNIGEVYECGERWDRMYTKRHCPSPDNADDPDYVDVVSCMNDANNADILDQQICGGPYEQTAVVFSRTLAKTLRQNLPHQPSYDFLIHMFLLGGCSAKMDKTMRQLMNYFAETLFVHDLFIEGMPQRAQRIPELTGELLCETWVDADKRQAFIDVNHAPRDKHSYGSGEAFSLYDYLLCACELHEGAVDHDDFIEAAKNLYLAAEVVTTFFALAATGLLSASALGVVFAGSLSRFRRALLLNLCAVDFASVWTICLGEHFHWQRRLDGYMVVWDVFIFEVAITLGLLTIDFNLAIFKPINYRYLVTACRTRVIIGGSWLFCIALSLGAVFGARKHIHALDLACLVLYLCGIFAVFLAHVVLILKIFHIQNESQALVVNVVGNRKIIEQTNRVAGAVVLVAVTTLVLVTPYCIYEFFLIANLTRSSSTECYHRETKLLITELTADMCIALNCVVDPMLYVLRLTDVRKGCSRAWRRFAVKVGLPHKPRASFSSVSSPRRFTGSTPRRTSVLPKSSLSNAPLLEDMKRRHTVSTTYSLSQRPNSDMCMPSPTLEYLGPSSRVAISPVSRTIEEVPSADDLLQFYSARTSFAVEERTTENASTSSDSNSNIVDSTRL